MGPTPGGRCLPGARHGTSILPRMTIPSRSGEPTAAGALARWPAESPGPGRAGTAPGRTGFAGAARGSRGPLRRAPLPSTPGAGTGGTATVPSSRGRASSRVPRRARAAGVQGPPPPLSPPPALGPAPPPPARAGRSPAPEHTSAHSSASASTTSRRAAMSPPSAPSPPPTAARGAIRTGGRAGRARAGRRRGAATRTARRPPPCARAWTHVRTRLSERAPAEAPHDPGGHAPRPGGVVGC